MHYGLYEHSNVFLAKSFIHLIKNYLLNIYSVPGTVLGNSKTLLPLSFQCIKENSNGVSFQMWLQVLWKAKYKLPMETNNTEEDLILENIIDSVSF